MAERLQISNALKAIPTNPFLKCELVPGRDPEEVALEAALFDFSTTGYEMGARVVSIPAQRTFATHVHPYAHHFIYVLQGTGIILYDGQTYILKPGDTCLVRKGIEHKLGAGEEDLLAIIVNTPTYDHDDPRHVSYLEEEILESVPLENDVFGDVYREGI